MAVMKRFRIPFLAVFTLLFSVLFASSPTFAASSVSNWHTVLKGEDTVNVGQSFKVGSSGTVTVMVDQYVKDTNGNEDRSQAANVTYYLYNVVSGKSVSFTVSASVGGALGAPASKTFTDVNAGTYIIKAQNNLSASVATGGNVYVSK
ncbi:hypothetical protein DCC85_01350 [Paenibacillus sp. CAA11]|uniref:hypothetical protein n=1 Tax=Paenibacillus sp. CAA11 TaxID=1532905 RepID=UPI000D3D2DFA|nr:hypothetical protein [Paenibacillus sp. CAA11]AWB43010.1 hypothetical protein DCC85_01350 [Paenibacillus sp. CAA11]